MVANLGDKEFCAATSNFLFMQVADIAQSLSSPLKREVITLLCRQNMTAVEVFQQLGRAAPKYRQSVNKTLESLKEGGLVRKYYNDTRKKLYYEIVKKKIVIDLDTMTIE